MSSSSTTLSLDHLLPSEQLCYVHCTICDTILRVSVPNTSLFTTVTIYCGHCANLLPVNMHGLLPPSFFSPSHNLLQEEMPNPTPNEFSMLARILADDELPRPPITNQPPEKRERAPTAYNYFVKDEYKRIKSVNPDITHREAFNAATKNWSLFQHIHSDLMSCLMKKTTNVCQLPAGRR